MNQGGHIVDQGGHLEDQQGHIVVQGGHNTTPDPALTYTVVHKT